MKFSRKFLSFTLENLNGKLIFDHFFSHFLGFRRLLVNFSPFRFSLLGFWGGGFSGWCGIQAESYMGTGVTPLTPSGGRVKSRKLRFYTTPSWPPGNDNVKNLKFLDEKFLCRNALKVKFTRSIFDPRRISLKLYKKSSPRNAQNEVFRKSILTPTPPPRPPLGVLLCPSMRILPPWWSTLYLFDLIFTGHQSNSMQIANHALLRSIK